MAIVACSGSGGAGTGADLPHFQDPSSAPAVIQKSARAVVRIELAGEAGTGSFISSTGLLLTNNHVLGAPVCPIEGCFASLSFNHQRGTEREDPVTVFALPKAVDLGLDVAVAQLFTDQTQTQPLDTPDFLTFDALNPAALLGVHATIMGHPEASLKKWTDGTISDLDGQWFQIAAFSLPGDSGSPALSDDGKILGLIHRGPTSQDLITSQSVNVYAVGTIASAVSGALTAPLPAAMLSMKADTTEAVVLENQDVYLNAHAQQVSIGGVQQDMLPILAKACDAALARTDYLSLDEQQTAIEPCFDAMSWIECRQELAAKNPWRTCPGTAEWTARFQALAEFERSLNGQIDLGTVSFAIAELSPDRASGIDAGSASLLAALGEAQAPLTLELAPYLAAFKILSYGGNVSTLVQNYRQIPHYELRAESIANAAAWLYDDGSWPPYQLESVLSALDRDPLVDVGSKLFVEEMAYEFGL